MVCVRTISEFSDPALAPYRTMRQQADHYRDRLFVAEGEKVVRRLIDSGLPLISLLLPEEYWREVQPLIAGRTEDITVYLGPKPLLEELTGFSMYQGVLACGQLPEPIPLDVLLGTSPRPRFLVAVDGLTNAENMGALVRNAVAFGAQGMLVGETCAHPYLRRAVRGSMGTVFQLPLVEPVSLAAALTELRRRGVRCVAAHPHTEERVLPQADLSGDCCVVLGSEGEGLSPEVREACDDRVVVPMRAGVDSLNVAAAAAVFFYEVWRQRR